MAAPVTIHAEDAFEDLPREPREEEPRPKRRRFSGRGGGFALPLGALALIALGLRLYGINWDQGYLFHPDERAILMKVVGLGFPWPPDLGVLLSVDSPLNPKWFPYGSFPLYLVKLIGYLASFVDPKMAGLDNLRFVGRAISATADVGTVVLIGLLGARLYRRSVGLLAAAFVAFAVLGIQQSHFFVVDVVLVFFMTLTVYCAARTMGGGGWIWTVLGGVAYGLAVASKVSVLPFGLVLVLAQILRTMPGDAGARINLRAWDASRLGPALLAIIVAVAVAGATFVIVAPYSFIDWKTFSENVIEQSEMVRRIRDYPYTRQYVDVPRFVYEIQQLTVWGLGLPLGIAGWLALFVTTVVVWPTRRKSDLLILTAIWPYFLLTGSFQVKFLRYLMPLVPFLSLLAARWLIAWYAWWNEGRGPARSTARRLIRGVPTAITGVILAATVFYALAFVNMYSQPHPAVAMSNWIKANVPNGSTLLKEHWEEGLPNLPGYKSEELKLYEDDRPQKVDELVQLLSQNGYVVFYSNRLYGAIPRLPQRYPATIEYYRSLFDGSLGYQLLNFEASYPNLFGVAFVDDTFSRPGLPVPEPLRQWVPAPISLNLGYADESFTVYDHPKVLIFGKTPAFQAPAIRANLQSALSVAQTSNPPPGQAATNTTAGKTGLVMTPRRAAEQQAGGTWSDLFNPNDLANRVPALTWLLFVEVLALFGLPLSILLMRRLPDNGFLLNKILSALIVVYLAWLGASLQLLEFSRRNIFLAVVVLGLASVAVGWPARRQLLATARRSWRTWLVGEGIFLAAFAAFYLIRLANPDLWHPARGGEKPMDFAYLNAVIKSTYFPPYDPWFAGGYLNYYYYGQVIVATVIKATGIVPTVAYNLAVPWLFALLAGGSFSIGFNLLAGRRSPVRPRPGLILAGLTAALFVAVFGNLDGLAQVVDGLAKASTLGFESAIPGLTAVVKGADGLIRIVGGSAQMPQFDFWRSSRMMPPTPNITEFPYFTMLFADLHAHLIALPFTVLAIGLGLAYVRTLQLAKGIAYTWRDRLPGRLASLGLLVAIGLTVGSLRAINSWDYPTYLLIGGWCLLIAELARSRRISVGALVRVGVAAVALFGLTTLLYKPFIDTYELFYTGVQMHGERTPFYQYAGTFGLFLFSVISLLVMEILRQGRYSPTIRTIAFFARHWPRLGRAVRGYTFWVEKGEAWLYLLAAVGLASLLVLGAIALILSPLIATLAVLLALVALVVIAEVRERRGDWPVRLFVWGLVAMGLAQGIGVDLINLQGDIGRMNTVFKFYLQAWVLYALAATFSLGLLVPAVLRRLTGPLPPRAALLTWPIFGSIAHSPALPRVAPRAISRPGWRPWEAAWLGVVGFLILASAIYPLAATPVRVADRFQPLPWTNDGAAFMQYAQYRDENRPIDLAADYQAIQWLWANVQGSPVIAEAVTPLYRWGSRVSVYTGLPTIIGWDWHQKQQRWGYQGMVDERLNDVKTLFTTPDANAALDLLRKYNVRYVYVGPVEKVYYPAPGLTKFQQLVGRGLQVAYDANGVTIYEVTPA